MKIIYGDDCSGICAPIQALKNLGIKIEHKFSSDIDKFARKSILANYNPEVLFEDMTVERELPKLDVYVAGFPCQPFSKAGKRGDTSDPRGKIFFSCVDTIKKTEPKLFILENVPSIMTINKGQTFQLIKKTLSEECPGYFIYYWVLNTKDYGIPQHRRRLYIVGSKEELERPKPIPCRSIYDFIDYSDTSVDEWPPCYVKREPQFKDAVFTNIAQLRLNNNHNKVCPNYSATLMASSQLVNVKMHRKANIKELLRLQGFPEDFKQVVSNTQMSRQIGNSMSVNVLEEIFKNLKNFFA